MTTARTTKHEAEPNRKGHEQQPTWPDQNHGGAEQAGEQGQQEPAAFGLALPSGDPEPELQGQQGAEGRIKARG